MTNNENACKHLFIGFYFFLKNEPFEEHFAESSYFAGTIEDKVGDCNADNITMTDTKPSQETMVPALGKFWQSICSTRLLVSRAENADLLSARISSSGSTNNIDLSLRTIRIIKCNQLKTGNQCTVNISDSGIR